MLALPVERQVIAQALTQSETLKPRWILLEGGKKGIRRNVADCFQQDIVIADTLKSMKEAGNDCSGFSAATSSGKDDPFPANSERPTMGKSPTRLSIVPVQERTKRRTGFPGRIVADVTHKLHGRCRSPVV